ncbi:branched-chain amino acid ABC transporter permease [Spongiactinospora sp. TRM90649]|uniref:branched-chain amino acid ABC transporter permease n=1 Tax=Spongiactinospora sp. TRM90649 TaxID=3031114 RepID=UPI0023F8EF0A|nr:branched-chain amino acid ABC transporter permease [Spongiactinospora sp. TRM90649]MDF5758300.1 branched-chain amino acid ABC transporter permease [Spongiactinospora sp. TRM90649]
MTYFLQQFVNGLSIGAQYSLWCVGYGLVYQVLGLMHFAHGDTLIFSAFFAATLMVLGVPFWLVVVAAMALAAVLAICIERAIYRPLMSRNQLFMAFIAAMAAGFILRNLVQRFWGVQPRVFPEGLLPSGSIMIGEIRIGHLALMNLAVAIVIVVAFQLFLNRSRHGQAILAVSQDRSTAELMGIKVNRIVALVYGLSGAIGMVGVFMYITSFRTITIGLGFLITLKAFIAAIIGGIGSIRGAVLGGMVLGVLEAMVSAYLSTTLLEAIVVVCLVAFLIVRPNGIVGIKESVKL